MIILKNKSLIILFIFLICLSFTCVDAKNKDKVSCDDKVCTIEKSNTKIYNVPILGNIDSKSVSLPLLSIVLGLVDGFNPCAMWILVFLISMLIGMKDKKRLIILGSCFILTSGIIYLLFMVSWLNLAMFLSKIVLIRMFIAIVSICLGVYNIYRYLKIINSDDDIGCDVTNTKQRKTIIDNIKKIVKEKSFIISLIGIILLACSVNILELLCSLGLPVIFTEILSFNKLNGFEYGLYMIIYILCFLLDDIIIFFIAIKTLKIKGISNKYTKYSHLIGGLIMLILGLLMIFAPSILM